MLEKLLIRPISLLAFRCWSRKKYAVFNSLQQVIKICTLSLVYSILALPEKAKAQEGSDTLKIKSYELGNVVVSAGRTPIGAQQSARIVTVISKSDIERSPSQNLNDLLRFIAGVDIRQRGVFGAQADISIRGGTYDQTLILLNGINVTDPQTGHHNLNLPVDLESIERIEILHGPAAKSFGPNAFNGAVNIITGNSKKNNIRASVMLGQYGLNKASANISNSVGNFEHFLSVSHISSDGYITNTDLTGTNLFYQAKFEPKAGKFDFQAGYNAKEFGANSFYSLKYPYQFEATKTEFISLKYQSNKSISFSPVFYFRRNRDLFELKRNNDSVPFNHHKTSIAGLNLSVWTTHLFGKTSLSADLRNEHIISNVLGNTLNIPVRVPNFDNAFYIKYFNRLNFCFNAEHNVSWKMFSLNAGIMAYNNREIKGIRLYPGFDMSYRLKGNFNIYASANKTLRMPTFTDMFYKSPVQKGYSGLKPEEAVTVEGGLKLNNTFLKGNISAFRRWGNNLIDWVKNPSPDSLIWRSLNHTQINFTGLESSLTYTSPESVKNRRIQSFNISYSLLQADSSSKNMLSKYALDYLRSRISASIDFRIAGKLFNSSRLTYQDRNGNYQDAAGLLLDYNSFWLSDTKIYWKENNFLLYVEASNIFNVNYFDFGGIVQPGRWLRTGFILDFKYRK